MVDERGSLENVKEGNNGKEGGVEEKKGRGVWEPNVSESSVSDENFFPFL